MVALGRLAAWTLLSAGVVAGSAVPFASCAASSGRPALGAVIHVGYAFGALVCHQRPERSFFSCARQWPVCGRCAGLYMGFAVGGVLVLATLARRKPPTAHDDEAMTRRWRWLLVAAAAPTAALWLTEFGVGLDPGTLVRWIGALPLGLTAALWLAAVARGDLR